MSNRHKKNKAEKRNYIVWTIRGLLILSLLINLAFIIFQLFSDHTVTKEELAEALNKRVELLFWALVTFTLTFLPDYFEKYQKIHIPYILETAIVAFIYAGIFLSARFELYYQVFWWDDVLHGLSGVIIGFIGFIAIYKINGKYSMNISPLLVAVFAFTFAITIGVIWEIFEFGMDILLGTTLQSWDLPDTEILMGKPFQGSGLRDTMSDLIVNSFGALFTSIICYFLYKNEKKKSLDIIMREIFPS